MVGLLQSARPGDSQMGVCVCMCVSVYLCMSVTMCMCLCVHVMVGLLWSQQRPGDSQGNVSETERERERECVCEGCVCVCTLQAPPHPEEACPHSPTQQSPYQACFPLLPFIAHCTLTRLQSGLVDGLAHTGQVCFTCLTPRAQHRCLAQSRSLWAIKQTSVWQSSARRYRSSDGFKRRQIQLVTESKEVDETGEQRAREGWGPALRTSPFQGQRSRGNLDEDIPEAVGAPGAWCQKGQEKVQGTEGGQQSNTAGEPLKSAVYDPSLQCLLPIL